MKVATSAARPCTPTGARSCHDSRLLLRPPLVAPPAEFVRAAFGNGGDVEPPVAVQVRSNDLVGVRPELLQHVLFPRDLPGVARVLEPDQLSLRPPGGGDNVGLAVAIQVRGEGFEGEG